MPSTDISAWQVSKYNKENNNKPSIPTPCNYLGHFTFRNNYNDISDQFKFNLAEWSSLWFQLPMSMMLYILI